MKASGWIKSRMFRAVAGKPEVLPEEARAGRVIGLVVGANYGGAECACIGSGSLVESLDIGIAAVVRLCNKLT